MPTSPKPPPARRPAEYHHGDLREALIEAALAILAQGGAPQTLSLREAARRAGVSAMAPYRHFADKEGLLAAVAEVGFTRLAAGLKTADAKHNLEHALIGQGVAYVAFAYANPSLFRLMFGNLLAERHGALLKASKHAYAIMEDRVRSLRGIGDPEGWALRCWATAHGLAALAIDGQLADGEAATLAVADRVLRLGTPSAIADRMFRGHRDPASGPRI